MIINELLEQRSMTKYRLAKNSGVPYTTIIDICSGKAHLEKCSAETIYKISKVLGVSMESLLEPCFIERSSFELFKSHVCHQVKGLGDIDFIIETLKHDDIRKFYQRKWYPECLYLLAMLDYISRQNQVPLCSGYDDLRKFRLQEPIYPTGIQMAAAAAKNSTIKEDACKEAIPEFMRFNIVENEVRDVI